MRLATLTVLGAMLILPAASPAEAQTSVPNTGAIGTMTGVPTPRDGQGVAALGRQGAGTNADGTPNTSAQSTLDKPIAYRDAERGFMLVAPPGARFQHHSDGGQIAIQSRRGYAVNVQAGDANPRATIADMFAKLEASYLGEGKPWAIKVGAEEGMVAGMPAGIAVYEAGSTRTRVVIARGAKTDFVFMFFAPVKMYEKLRPDFDWIMASFRPGEGEAQEQPARLAAAEEPATPPLRADTRPAVNPAGRPAPETASVPATVRVFAEGGYGYRLEYPETWRLEKVSAFTNVISGPKGTPAFDAIVSLQNVKPTGPLDPDEVARAAFEDLKMALGREARSVDFVGEKAVTYDKAGLMLEGRQFVASYDHNGTRFRKWALVLPRPEGGVAHIWSYTAPVDRFDAYRAVAERILQSLKIDPGQG